MPRVIKHLVIASFAFIVAGCETAYYNAMEKVGIEKRDILIDRIEDTRDAQEDTQEQFKDALEQYRAVVNFNGGDLEKMYNRLSDEYEDSSEAANKIADRIREVEDVAEDLFDEWEKELELIGNDRLRSDSANKLRDTRYQYKQLVKTMWQAENSVHPVLDTLRDQVYYLKHNLNARAISSLKNELQNIDADVGRLIAQMQRSINEANDFIKNMQN